MHPNQRTPWRSLVVAMTLLLLAIQLSGQTVNPKELSAIDDRMDLRRRSITMGILQGGGSLVGFDVEMLVSDYVGLQVGAGIIGFGAGLNFHFKPTIRSSFMSLQYWHQGFGETYTQSVLGPAYVFRAKKIFTFQAGFGFPLEKGPGWTMEEDPPPIMLTYAIGIYLPF